jgi:hypothetical protein
MNVKKMILIIIIFVSFKLIASDKLLVKITYIHNTLEIKKVAWGQTGGMPMDLDADFTQLMYVDQKTFSTELQKLFLKNNIIQSLKKRNILPDEVEITNHVTDFIDKINNEKQN